ncbi:MAG: phosphoribosylglycinamide formyltransferase [Gammaproteobacteria bacterium]|nr:phosphoribosylglycinamide formyltransferase [Gammaproteobacteria bacterium]
MLKAVRPVKSSLPEINTTILPIVILISGRGSNLHAIMDHIEQQQLPVKIRAVISDRANAPGLQRPQQAGIPVHILGYQHDNREQYDQALIELIDQSNPDIICLAGFMRILSPLFVRHYHGRLINIHPSLLPNLKGLHTHQRALDAGYSEHGASVHYVNEELDGGPIIMQATVPVYANDKEDTLASRVLQQEHQLYARVLRMIADGQIHYQADGVYYNGKRLLSALKLNNHHPIHSRDRDNASLTETVSRMDAAVEPPGMVSLRVSDKEE